MVDEWKMIYTLQDDLKVGQAGPKLIVYQF